VNAMHYNRTTTKKNEKLQCACLIWNHLHIWNGIENSSKRRKNTTLR